MRGLLVGNREAGAEPNSSSHAFSPQGQEEDGSSSQTKACQMLAASEIPGENVKSQVTQTYFQNVWLTRSAVVSKTIHFF